VQFQNVDIRTNLSRNCSRITQHYRTCDVRRTTDIHCGVSNDVIIRLVDCMRQVRDCGAAMRRRRELHALHRLWWSFPCIISPSPARFGCLISLIRFEDWLRALRIAFISNSSCVQWDYVTAQLLHIVIKLLSVFSVMEPHLQCFGYK